MCANPGRANWIRSQPSYDLGSSCEWEESFLASTTSVEPRPGSVVPDEKAASVRKAVYKDVVFPGSDDLIVDHDRCCESHARIENIRAHVVVPQLVGKIVGIVSMQAHGAFRILGFSPNDRVGTSVGRHNGVSAPVQECRYRPRRRSRGQYATRESVLPQVSVRGSQIDASVPVGGIAIETLPTRTVGACGSLSGLASFVAYKELLRDLCIGGIEFSKVRSIQKVETPLLTAGHREGLASASSAGQQQQTSRADFEISIIDTRVIRRRVVVEDLERAVGQLQF